jgi:hypothetical protein
MSEMKALDHLAGVAICARATKPHGTVMLIQGMRTARETPSGGSLGVVGGLRQVTSKIQRATPRDLVHVSIFAGGNRIGASKASLNGGPKLSTSDDGGMSIILSGGGKGGIDIHPTAAASDRSRVKATDDRKRMGANYSPRCLHDTRYSNTPVRPSAAPPGRQTARLCRWSTERQENPTIGGRMPLLLNPRQTFPLIPAENMSESPEPPLPTSKTIVTRLKEFYLFFLT